MCASCPRSLEEGVGSSRTGVAGSCEVTCEHWEPILGTLQDQQVLSITPNFKTVSEKKKKKHGHVTFKPEIKEE